MRKEVEVMARPKKPLAQQKGNLTTEKQEELKETEEKLKQLTPIQKNPPSWLTTPAKKEYKRIIKLLEELDIADLDLAMISTYCQAYADFQQATKELAKGEVVTFTERGSKVNPWHRVKVDSYGIINSIAPKMGLTLDSRMKIMTPKPQEEQVDKFGALFDD